MNQKTYVITGAASGIGRCCAKSLCLHHNQLILVDIQQEALLDTKRELLQNHPQLNENSITTLCLDLAKADALSSLSAALAVIPCLDGMIHCAGIIGEYGRCHEMDLSQMRQVIDHQLFSAIHAAHCALPKFCEQRGGSMVFVGGVGGNVALPHLPAYTIALHGLNGLVRSLALDYGKDKIRINGVLPAATHTPLFKKAQTTHTAAQRSGSLMKNAVPLGKVASTKEVSDLIVFLLSAQASHISGALIPVDGGFLTY